MTPIQASTQTLSAIFKAPVRDVQVVSHEPRSITTHSHIGGLVNIPERGFVGSIGQATLSGDPTGATLRFIGNNNSTIDAQFVRNPDPNSDRGASGVTIRSADGQTQTYGPGTAEFKKYVAPLQAFSNQLAPNTAVRAKPN